MEVADGGDWVGPTIGSRVSDPQGFFGIGRVTSLSPDGHEVAWLTLSGVEMREIVRGAPRPLPDAIVADVRDDDGEFWRVDVTEAVLGLDVGRLRGLRDGALEREECKVLHEVLKASGYALGGSARVTPQVASYFGVAAGAGLAGVQEFDIVQARAMSAAPPEPSPAVRVRG